MSFRTEEKFFINSDKYVDLKNYLILKGANRQYPRRLIKSIYFDNDNLQSFIDSQEGSVVRKKIRMLPTSYLFSYLLWLPHFFCNA